MAISEEMEELRPVQSQLIRLNPHDYEYDPHGQVHVWFIDARIYRVANICRAAFEAEENETWKFIVQFSKLEEALDLLFRKLRKTIPNPV